MDPFACRHFWKRESLQTCKSGLDIELGRTLAGLLVGPQTQSRYVLLHSMAGTLEQRNQKQTLRNTSKSKREFVQHNSITILKQETVMTRLRIGHTWITHSYLLKKEDQPFCHACDNPFTVKHILIECSDFTHIRNKYYTTTDVHTLFREVDSSKITEYLKEIKLFDKI